MENLFNECLSHFDLIKYKAVPSGSAKCKNWPPSSLLSVTAIDNFSSVDLVSSILSLVKPMDTFPEFPFKFPSLVG